MSEQSAIEWTDATWNPTTGCTKVSPACANCYIERQTPFRVAGRKFVNGHIPLEFHENRLTQPSRWKQPRLIFVNSMSDLFHEDVPDAFLHRVYDEMEHARHHTYQVLTKRAERMRDYLQWRYSGPRLRPWHIWHGVSAENQRMLYQRGECLRQTPSRVRFISAEPLLGPLHLDVYLPMLSWVIVGGESGPHLRPTSPDWVRDIRDQCVTARVPFFFKQWGGKTAKSGGRALDGRTWDEMPERHTGRVPA
jgi:protein gp37